jgi:hypothetical protein
MPAQLYLRPLAGRLETTVSRGRDVGREGGGNSFAEMRHTFPTPQSSRSYGFNTDPAS